MNINIVSFSSLALESQEIIGLGDIEHRPAYFQSVFNKVSASQGKILVRNSIFNKIFNRHMHKRLSISSENVR